ncbi:transposase domain containing protein [Trichonephila clavipes]|nr:transposase domain containing protein [Trichonephila clavipes]
MGKAGDLSDFDRGHIVMARRLETSISETARLVDCSRSTVISTYARVVGHTQAGSGGIMLWGMFSWVTLGPVVGIEQTRNVTGYLKMITDQLHPYMAYVFPAGNRMFQLGNAPCQKSKIVLEWFQKHDAEFQLMSWPTNSSDINPIEYIWDVMGRQLRVQRPPIRNISDLCDRCLNI